MEQKNGRLGTILKASSRKEKEGRKDGKDL